MSKTIYVHDAGDHNMDDPNEIVPVLYKYFAPSSVVDLGCGIGNFLYKFRECGAKRILGIDGEWCLSDLQMLDRESLLLTNITQPFKRPDGKFDLAMSLEVAEHLEEKYADKIIDDLTAMSDLVVFSAALVQQGGQNHLNEQWPDYWVKKFNARGFVCFDPLRTLLWNNPKIKFWYKQNMFVAIKATDTQRIEKLKADFPHVVGGENRVNSLIHPDQLKLKTVRIDRLVRMFKGKASLEEYKMEIAKVLGKKNQ